MSEYKTDEEIIEELAMVPKTEKRIAEHIHPTTGTILSTGHVVDGPTFIFHGFYVENPEITFDIVHEPWSER